MRLFDLAPLPDEPINQISNGVLWLIVAAVVVLAAVAVILIVRVKRKKQLPCDESKATEQK